jgi:hypothetical protein
MGRSSFSYFFIYYLTKERIQGVTVPLQLNHVGNMGNMVNIDRGRWVPSIISGGCLILQGYKQKKSP